MAEYAKLPKIGLTMKTGTITKFKVQAGDTVKKGDVLADFETDKITGEVESPADGIVLEILVGEGEEVEVLAPLVLVGMPGEKTEKSAEAGAKKPEAAAAPFTPDEPQKTPEMVTLDNGFIRATPLARRIARQTGIDLISVSAFSPDGIIRKKDVEAAIENNVIRATPLAKKIAEENGIDLSKVTGMGPNGRIGREDVMGAMAQAAQTKAPPATMPANGALRKKMSPMRKTIANRLSESKQTIPHVYFKSEVDASSLMALKDSLKAAAVSGNAPKITVNDILLKAVAATLKQMPELFAQLAGDELVYFDDVNLGMAVNVAGGLIVPVIHGADRLCLADMARASANLIEKAHGGKLAPEEFSDGNFTVSNLGASGIDEFSAIINPPEAGILAVGAIRDKVVAVNKQMEIRPMMTLTLSVDHRIIDGALAADFLKKLKETLENICLALI